MSIIKRIQEWRKERKEQRLFEARLNMLKRCATDKDMELLRNEEIFLNRKY